MILPPLKNVSFYLLVRYILHTYFFTFLFSNTNEKNNKTWLKIFLVKTNFINEKHI